MAIGFRLGPIRRDKVGIFSGIVVFFETKPVDLVFLLSRHLKTPCSAKTQPRDGAPVSSLFQDRLLSVVFCSRQVESFMQPPVQWGNLERSHHPVQTEVDLDSIDEPQERPLAPVFIAELAETQPLRSWPFRLVNWLSQFLSAVFGAVSVVFLLAVTANIPLVQLASFGYLLESSGRVGRTGKLRSGLIGFEKASRVGRFVIGAWICVLPIRFLSDYWYSAWLIDPTSTQTNVLRGFQIALLVLTIFHILAAWLCGGRLRQFFWPIIAPFQLAIWTLRRMMSSRLLSQLLDSTAGRIAPQLFADIRETEPLANWFLPAVLIRKMRSGRILSDAADELWSFFASLRPRYYFMLGTKGFVGSFIWLIVPTLLLVRATGRDDGVAIFCGILGTMLATGVFTILIFQQTHFAVHGQLRNFWQIRKSFRVFRKAPLWHLLAALIALIFALPLYLLKIEEIPGELLWSLSIVFLLFSWPTRIMLGWAYGRSRRRERPRAWWWSFPLAALVVPLCFLFVFIMFFTRYTSWNGALSMFENHVFLLPAPFWLGL